MNTFFPSPHRDDVLANLTPEQRALLDQWLLDGKTYSQIANDPHLDDEQKVWLARTHLFGALPDTEPQPKSITQFIQ